MKEIMYKPSEQLSEADHVSNFIFRLHLKVPDHYHHKSGFIYRDDGNDLAPLNAAEI